MSKHYQELKAKGVEFPVLDPDLASQAFIPEKVLTVVRHFWHLPLLITGPPGQSRQTSMLSGICHRRLRHL